MTESYKIVLGVIGSDCHVVGNLVVGKKDWDAVEALFLEMGYDRVFSPNTDLARAVRLLNDDIDMQRICRLGHNSKQQYVPMAAVV